MFGKYEHITRESTLRCLLDWTWDVRYHRQSSFKNYMLWFYDVGSYSKWCSAFSPHPVSLMPRGANRRVTQLVMYAQRVALHSANRSSSGPSRGRKLLSVVTSNCGRLTLL